MIKKTIQMEAWGGKFGEEYTDRNPQTIEQLEKLYLKRIGITREQINNRFLKGLPISNVLEVGANTGVQLITLHDLLKLKNLYGIEISEYAINKAKELTSGKDINIIKGSALELPFKDKTFDLVMTGGLLIHISPLDINKVMDEIYRCSGKYIFGYEYYSDKALEVPYRENSNLLWKTNFAKLFLERFPKLRLVREEKYPYLSDTKLIDQAYLLEKTE